MNPPDLKSLLKKARLPAPPEESWERFPRQIVTRLRRGEPAARPRPARLPRFAWAYGFAAGVLLTLALSHFWSARPPAAAPGEDWASAKVIRETLALFPNRVRAIVQDSHGLNLVLSEDGDVPVSTPIYVRLCAGKQCSSFVTFSGQELQIAGQTVTVLADPRGGIILTGPRFVWSSTEPAAKTGQPQIEARNIELAAR